MHEIMHEKCTKAGQSVMLLPVYFFLDQVHASPLKTNGTTVFSVK